MLFSTRSDVAATPSQAIVKGLCDDGGLFFFKNIEGFPFDERLVDLDYKSLAKVVLRFFFDDFAAEDISGIVDRAYSPENFSVPVFLREACGQAYLELFHGPTCAFKDMALTVLSGLLSRAKNNIGDRSKTLILTATSGDTGSATLSGFSSGEAKVVVLYPSGGVSPVQEAQMQHFAVNGSRAVAVGGNFDDCQTLVKKVFADRTFEHSAELSSANSINVGRLVPQVVYYIYSYLELVRKKRIKFGDGIVFSVPTGNFGDILAGYVAKLAGVPITRLVCASNANDVLTDFFKNGVYDRVRPFRKTISPSMDILVSSNLERLLYLESGCDGGYVRSLMSDLAERGRYEVSADLKKKLGYFYPFSLDDEGTAREIKRVFSESGYLIDPHTAVASAALKSFAESTGYDGAGVVVSTASPYKFPLPVSAALGLPAERDVFASIAALEDFSKNPAPERIKSLNGERFSAEFWAKSEAEEKLKELIKRY